MHGANVKIKPPHLTHMMNGKLAIHFNSIGVSSLKMTIMPKHVAEN